MSFALTMSRALGRLSIVKRHLKLASVSMSSRLEEEVTLENIDDKGLITLNRPSALNALNLSMARTIQPVLKKWQDEHQVKFVIIKSVGGKAFCAGGDIRAIADARTGDRSIQRDFFREEYVLNYTIGTLNVPWIALIDGITMGGGVGLSVHGRYRVATERTVFAMPETAIGLFPDVGGGHFLPRLQGKLGLFLALTGYRLKGRDVVNAGVATHFVESSMISALEKELLSLSPAGVGDIDRVLLNFQNKSSRDADKPFSLVQEMSRINSLFDSTTVEGVIENLRRDGSDWAKTQMQTIAKMSPTSLKVTLRQLNEGATMNLQQVLRMEYRLSQRCMLDNDFYEGVRAVVIDKDMKPVWKPSRLEDVTDEKIDSYFAPLPANQELVL